MLDSDDSSPIVPFYEAGGSALYTSTLLATDRATSGKGQHRPRQGMKVTEWEDNRNGGREGNERS